MAKTFVRKAAETETPVPAKGKAKVASKPAPAAAEPEAAERSGKNIGRTTGMRIMQFQDQTMADQPKNRLTDEELAAKWQEEFPESRCRFEERLDVVRTVRRLFNENKHGSQTIRPPKDGVSKYEIQGKQRVAVAEEPRGRKASSEEEPVSKAADAPRRKAS